MVRNKKLSFRVSEEEEIKIKRKAEDANLDLPTYLRIVSLKSVIEMDIHNIKLEEVKQK